MFFFVSPQSTHVTDVQNYDPQDCASIAASRGKMSYSIVCMRIHHMCNVRV